MVLTLRGQKYRYECENLCRLFFPYSPVKVDQEEPPRQGEPWALVCIEEREGEYVYRVEAGDGDRSLAREETRDRLEEYGITDLLYRALSELTGYTPAWGMLTGIHPVKLLRQYTDELGEQAGAEKFRAHCHVSREKTDLALATLRGQQAAVEDLGENDFALYVSIPFCPTRCAYCSFVSQDMEHARKLMDPYFQLLLEEIGKTGQVAKDLGLSLRSVYIGGGTPTTLTAGQLHALLGRMEEALDLSGCTEFTVEAGRPDTITAEKLAVLRAHGVDRVSVNPQTMEDHVLSAMGRSHTAGDILAAMDLVRESGIPLVNMDLIAGLPQDTLAGFCRSLDQVMAQAPANITVHTLALKRGARLMEGREGLPPAEEVAAMLDYAGKALRGAGYRPYYLYRQKYMSGSFENVGWCLPGTVNAYNICMMEELHPVLSLGAGGVTKLVGGQGRITRLSNPKYPQEYIQQLEQSLAHQETAEAFLRDRR